MDSGQQTRQILERVRTSSPEAQKVRETWQERSPSETVAASRQLLHGVVMPALQEAGVDTAETLEIEAIFESTFNKVEQQQYAKR